MKVGEQQVGDLETIPGSNEQRSLARPGPYMPAVVGRGLDQAQSCSADCNDPGAARPTGGDLFYRINADLSSFCVHDMILDPLGLHRQEGAGTNMQRHRRAANVRSFERR
jgi:hypothetical protein